MILFTDKEQTWVNLGKVDGGTPKSSEGNAVDPSIYEKYRSNGDMTQRYRIYDEGGFVKLDDWTADSLYAVLCQIEKSFID